MFRPSTRARWPGLAVLAAVAAVAFGVPGVRAVADVPPPNCDVDCFPPPDSGGGGGGTGGTVGEGGVAVGGSTVVLASPERTFIQQGFTGVNDVASASDGSVWIITGSSTLRVEGGAFGGPGSFPIGGARLAVGPSGLPWMVGFDGSIRRGNADGSTTLMPGLARDIGIGGQGSVWVIGTNSRNGSFQVYAWNGSTWIADPGSGQSIDVDAAGRPVVNGSDYKIWIKDGGADQGWSQLTGRATDMSEGHGSPGGFPGASDLWIIGHDERPVGSGNFGVWTFTAFNATWTLTNQFFGAQRVAVDLFGSPWAVRGDGTLWRA